MKKKLIFRIFGLILSLVLISTCGLFACGENKQIGKLSDLNGKINAIEEDSVHEAVVTEALDGCELLEKKSNGECVSELLTNKVDAVALDYLMAKSFLNKTEGIVMLEDKLNETEYGFAFNKDDERKNSFDVVLAEMLNDGRIENIINKWITTGQKSGIVQDWAGNNGKLICEVDPDVEPICYKDENDKIVGIDIDIILTIAKELDYKIEFIENDFDDLVLSLVSGEADLIASGLTITEAREKRVDFTVGYLDASTVLLVLDKSYNDNFSGFIKSVKSGFNSTFRDKENLDDLLNGLLVTIALIFSTIVLGFFLGSGFFRAYYYGNNFLKKLLSKITDIFTRCPVSTWLLICYYLIFPVRNNLGYLVAIFALSISFSFQVLDCYVGALFSLPDGQIEAAVSMGYSKRLTLKKIIFPQISSKFLNSLERETIYQVKDTSLVSFIAVQDIQAIANALSIKTAEPFFPIILTASIYMLLSFVISMFIIYLNKKLFPKEIDVKRLKTRVNRGLKK